MLKLEENELLCRVGPTTPMGDLLRQYWLPVLLSSELPAPDATPVRVRHLGENLIAFRDTTGAVGLVAENCPHRGASLFFGRNEECGLRCVYHGWKFDTSGACVDMPNEPPESNFKDKVSVGAYLTRERHGVVWAYLGDPTDAPGLPEIEWATLPESQVYISKRVQECNFVQGMEGGIDSSHSAFLHARTNVLGSAGVPRVSLGPAISARDKHPRFETVDTDFGVTIAARRTADDDHYYWRVTQFVMPFYNIIPPYGESPTIGGLAWVPMDDHTTMVWSISWHPTRPLTEAELDQRRGYPGGGIHIGQAGMATPTTAQGGAFRPIANASNDYQLDRELQKTAYFFGVANLSLQDQAVQESMGPIYDRSQEHLGSSDTGIIAVRRRMLEAARGLRDGNPPALGRSAESARVRSAALIIPKNQDWQEAMQEHLVMQPGVDYVAV